MVVQHWRGEHTLKRIFWLDFVVLGVVVVLAGGVIADGLSGRAAVRVNVLLTVASLLWPAWILVAIWRRGERSPLAGQVGASMAVLVWMLAPAKTLANLVVVDRQARIIARVQNALTHAGPARRALELACADGGLRPGMSHADLELAEPADYAGAHVDGVGVETLAAGEVRVAVTVTRPGPDIAPRRHVTWLGRCEDRSLRWHAIDSDLPADLVEVLRRAVL